MSQTQLQAAKNSLASTGANVKNFGMSVDSNGKTSFFATVEKAAEKKAEKKAAEKKAEEKVTEKKATEEADGEVSNEPIDDKDYVEIDAPTMESLVNQVSKYAYDNSARNVMTDGEKQLGQNFDFKG